MTDLSLDTKTFASRALLAATVLLLSACGASSLATTLPADEPRRPEVEMVRLSHTVPAESDGAAAVSLETLDQLFAFVDRLEAGYGDTVILDAGTAVSDERLEGLERFIRARGLTYGGRQAIGVAPADDSVHFILERYTLIIPECGEWSDEATAARANNSSAHWGCSTMRNRALMVANPRDLIDGQRSEGNGDAVVAIRNRELRNQALGAPGAQGAAGQQQQQNGPMRDRPRN